MARGINKLSAKAVSGAKEPGLYADGGNLYLQVSNVGGKGVTKSWVFRYMLDGRARKMGLGRVDSPQARGFTLAEARERAREAYKLLADDDDPIEIRLATRDAKRRDEAERMPFKDAANKYIALYEPTWRNAKHRQQWRNTLATHAFPALGTRPVKAIDAALVNATLADVAAKTPETASRVVRRIGLVCEWVKAGMPLPSPSASKRKRHQPALPRKDVAAFMADLRALDSVSARALEFTVLTAARTGTTIGATWAEIDLDKGIWTVPMSRAGTKLAKRDHRVPLPERALQILRELSREVGNDHIFPGGKEGRGLSDMALNELVKGMHASKEKEDGKGWVDPDQDGRRIVPHGFRSTFKDWSGSEAHYPDLLSEIALAHTDKDKVRAAYLRDDMLEKRRKLMKDWAAYCARSPVTGSNVVDLGEQRRAG